MTETVKIDELTPDSKNANRGTQSGLRALDQDMYSSIMYFIMAFMADSHTIGNIKSKIGIFSPFFYVMCNEFPASFVAFLARVVVSSKNILAPFFVDVPRRVYASFRFVAFVPRMLVAFLEMLCVFPVWIRRAFLDTAHKIGSKLFVLPSFFCSNAITGFFCNATKFCGAVFLIIRWRTSEILTAHYARLYKYWVTAITGTIDTTTKFIFTWYYGKFLTAPGAYSINSFPFLLPAVFIGAIAGTENIFTYADAVFIGVVFLSTVIALSNHGNKKCRSDFPVCYLDSTDQNGKRILSQTALSRYNILYHSESVAA